MVLALRGADRKSSPQGDMPFRANTSRCSALLCYRVAERQGIAWEGKPRQPCCSSKARCCPWMSRGNGVSLGTGLKSSHLLNGQREGRW